MISKVHKVRLSSFNRSDIKEQHFNSLAELKAYIKNTPINQHFTGECLASRSHEGEYGKFYLTADYKEAEDLMEHGWDAGIEKLNTIINSKPIINGKKSRTQYDMVGFQASVPRYLQGIPTSMINKKQIVTKSKVLTINKIIGCHAGITANEILEQSAKALRIIQLLENKGYRCNLNVMNVVRDWDGNSIMFTAAVKKAQEKLNLSKMAYPLAHPSMLRRMFFAWLERTDICTTGMVGGYGQPITNHDDAVEDLQKYFSKQNVIVIPAIMYETEEEFIETILAGK